MVATKITSPIRIYSKNIFGMVRTEFNGISEQIMVKGFNSKPDTKKGVMVIDHPSDQGSRGFLVTHLRDDFMGDYAERMSREVERRESEGYQVIVAERDDEGYRCAYFNKNGEKYDKS